MKCAHAHTVADLFAYLFLILPQEHGFFRKARTRLHAFVISPAQNPFSPFIGIFLIPNFQTEDSQQVGEPPPNPEFIFPLLQASRPLNRSMAHKAQLYRVLCQIETYAYTGVCIHMFMQEHRHTGTRVRTEYVSTQSTHTYLCTHTYINIQTPKHTHIPPA